MKIIALGVAGVVFGAPGGGIGVAIGAVVGIVALPALDQRGAHLTFQILDSGLRGVAALSSGLLIAGDGGVVYRPLSSGGWLGNPHVILTSPARGATALRDIGCVLLEEGVQVIDAALRPRAFLPMVAAEAIGTLSGYLAVLHESSRRLTLFALGRGPDPMLQAAGTIDIPTNVQFPVTPLWALLKLQRLWSSAQTKQDPCGA